MFGLVGYKAKTKQRPPLLESGSIKVIILNLNSRLAKTIWLKLSNNMSQFLSTQTLWEKKGCPKIEKNDVL